MVCIRCLFILVPAVALVGDQIASDCIKKVPRKVHSICLCMRQMQKQSADICLEGFSVRMPYIIITHKMHRNLPWLAGHGYNVTTFNVPVTYCGTNDEIKGQYQLAIWENHADPIICGREQLGYSKIYADITDICEEEDGTYAALSSWNFEFLKLHFKMDEKPDDLSEMQKVLFDMRSNEGDHAYYKYIPQISEAGFNKADARICYNNTETHFLHLRMPNLCLSLKRKEYGGPLLQNGGYLSGKICRPVPDRTGLGFVADIAGCRGFQGTFVAL